ncbi:MAG TPA: formylglycine-generating enzyme family protein, partial [Planctomycetota bacterium]|nr:formylglycine-generating enzyme family protein [Planctomycetota bacterium]
MRRLAIVVFLPCLAVLGCGPEATHGKSKSEAIERRADGPNAAPATRIEGEPPKLKNSLGMEFVFIKPGTFMMGSGRTSEAEEYEQPQHRVTLTRGFYMGTSEVTCGQFAQFLRAAGYKTDAELDGWAYNWTEQGWKKEAEACWKAPGFPQEDSHPVVDVSWNDAVAFCRWLGDKEGKSYRLPTEAEWEYACRAGSTTAYPWGSDPDVGQGWCNAADLTGKEKFSSWATCKWADGHFFTAPVCSFKANAFGLYDMSGNVREWCADWYGSYPSEAVTDPTGPADGTERVIRGGSWDCLPKDCRSAMR